ncbi:MAG: class I SAM-dependent methyltransferase [Myxococcales bacterium]
MTRNATKPTKSRGTAPKRDAGSALSQRIQRGAVAHYEDPHYYDHTYKRRRNDVRFYVDLVKERPGAVLELGVGTGRVALALARAGVETVGIEPVPAMLQHARIKREALPAAAQSCLELRAGDARTLRLKRRFPWVIAPFNVFMHLYTRRELEQAFASVRAHLAPRGRFVFDVLMPDLHAMVRRPGKLYKGPALTEPNTGRRYEYFEAFEYQHERQVQLVSMVFQNLSELGDLKIVPLSQRQFFPQELEALLHYNGFTVEHVWGDFSRAPLCAESESQIVVARAR